jgi:MFS family permease
LIKWFPDRRGMATGMAIMGFGGGAMIGSPLAAELMKVFATDDPKSASIKPLSAWHLVYFVFMMAGALGYRIPATGWKPAGWTPPVQQASQCHDHPSAMCMSAKSGAFPSFGWSWLVLCMNVSAGIGVIGMASPMLQEVFGGSLDRVSTPSLLTLTKPN